MNLKTSRSCYTILVLSVPLLSRLTAQRWLTVGSQLAHFWLTADLLLAFCWSTALLLADCWLTAGLLLADGWLIAGLLLAHCTAGELFTAGLLLAVLAYC